MKLAPALVKQVQVTKTVDWWVLEYSGCCTWTADAGTDIGWRRGALLPLGAGIRYMLPSNRPASRR